MQSCLLCLGPSLFCGQKGIKIWSKRSEQYRGKSEPDDGLLLRCRLPGSGHSCRDGGHSCRDGGRLPRLLLQNSLGSQQLLTDCGPLDRLFMVLKERLEPTHIFLLLLLPLFWCCLHGETNSEQVVESRMSAVQIFASAWHYRRRRVSTLPAYCISGRCHIDC